MKVPFGRNLLALALSLFVVVPTIAHAFPDPAPDPRAVVNEFYTAFCAGDKATLERLYAPDVKYQDTIFTFSDRAGTMGMWNILDNPQPGKFTYQILAVDGDKVTAHWDAYYTFPLTGRPVHNSITAEMIVKNGKIVQHHDTYPWRGWAAQAFPFGSASDFGPVRTVLQAGLRTLIRVGTAIQNVKTMKTPGFIRKLEGH